MERKELRREGVRTPEAAQLIPSHARRPTPTRFPRGQRACATARRACALPRRGLRKFPFTRPLRQAPVSPSCSFLLVPAGRIPRTSSLPTKLPRVPEPSATYLGGFGTFPDSPAPRAQPERRRSGDEDGGGLAPDSGGRGRGAEVPRPRFRRGLPGPCSPLPARVYLQPPTPIQLHWRTRVFLFFFFCSL